MTDHCDTSTARHVLPTLRRAAENPEFVALLHLCQKRAPLVILQAERNSEENLYAQANARPFSLIDRHPLLQPLFADSPGPPRDGHDDRATARPAASIKLAPATSKARRNRMQCFLPHADRRCKI